MAATRVAAAAEGTEAVARDGGAGARAAAARRLREAGRCRLPPG